MLGRNLSRKDLLVLWSIKFHLCWVYTGHNIISVDAQKLPYDVWLDVFASSDSISFTLTQFRCMQWIAYHNMSPTWHIQLARKFKSTEFTWNNWKWKTGMSWLLCKIGCKSEMCTLIRLCTSTKYEQRRRLWANNVMPIFIDVGRVLLAIIYVFGKQDTSSNIFPAKQWMNLFVQHSNDSS